MRILIFSAAPWANTGYGQQTAQLAPRLKAAGHDVAIAAMWGLNGNSLNWNGIPVYPSDDRWGNMFLADYAKVHEADLIITLIDVHVFTDPRLKELPLASWVPVDHKPVPPAVANFFPAFGARPIAMSRFGEAELGELGLDPVYVPHGIDTTVFAPMDRDEAKKRRGLDGKFVVGMVANNAGHTPSRKAFPQALFAFSRFRLDHPDAILYLHTDMTGKRSPARTAASTSPRLLARYEIPPEAVTYTDPVAMDLGIPPETMASLYCAFDVLLNPSYGEGFGVPIVEAQACGTPVIVTDWTSMTELCGAGWLVGGDIWDDVQHGAFYRAPSHGGHLRGARVRRTRRAASRAVA